MAILDSLIQPGATRAQVSEAHHLSAAELALWLAQLHIQAAFDHLVNQLPGETFTSEPAIRETDRVHAHKRVILSYSDDQPRHFLLRF